MPLMMLGFPEIMVIAILVIVIFGASRLPQLGSGLGRGIRNFKDSVTGKDEEALEDENSANKQDP